MITDINDRPKVNALAPLPMPGKGNRPSLMQAIANESHFKTNFIEQNKSTLKGHSQVAAAHRKDYGTGKLPSLGLSKYTSNDFEDDTRNPFKVQVTTEKMLVMRELEREFVELNKHHKDTLMVYEKGIESRIDRAGARRRI